MRNVEFLVHPLTYSERVLFQSEFFFPVVLIRGGRRESDRSEHRTRRRTAADGAETESRWQGGTADDHRRERCGYRAPDGPADRTAGEALCFYCGRITAET